MSEHTTFKARIPGNAETGIFTQAACESLVGQDNIHLGNTGSWDKAPDGKGRVTAAELDGDDVIVTIEVTGGSIPHGLTGVSIGPGVSQDAVEASCGFVLPDRAAAMTKDLSRMRLLTVWPAPAIAAMPGTATEMLARNKGDQ